LPTKGKKDLIIFGLFFLYEDFWNMIVLACVGTWD
jgi:hypothetical protein